MVSKAQNRKFFISIFAYIKEHVANVLHTYTIGQRNPLVRIATELLTLLICIMLILYMSGGNYVLKSIQEIFKKLFKPILFTLRITT